MKTSTAIKEIMHTRGFSNETLSKQLGYKHASGVSERLRSDIRVSILLKILDAMGCELVIRSKLSDKGVWVINGKDEGIITPEEQKELLK
ncbi:MAG: hypothetical protein PUF49_05065 [Firmicutes bacterium]|nr:hypothetical protein [Bacillota bacterium]